MDSVKKSKFINLYYNYNNFMIMSVDDIISFQKERIK